MYVVLFIRFASGAKQELYHLFAEKIYSSGNKEWKKRDGEYNFSIMWGNGMPAPEGEDDDEDIAFSLSFKEGSRTVVINYGLW